MRPGTSSEISEEERLRRENEELRNRLQAIESRGHAHAGVPSKLWHPSRLTIWSIFLIAIVLVIVAFFAGYIPLHQRSALVQAEAERQETALPRVEVVQVGRSSLQSDLQLPGSIQACGTIR